MDSFLRKEQGGLSSGHTLRFSLKFPSSKTTARLTTAARKSRLPQPRSSLSPNARLSRKEAVNASRLYSMQKRHGLLKGVKPDSSPENPRIMRALAKAAEKREATPVALREAKLQLDESARHRMMTAKSPSNTAPPPADSTETEMDDLLDLLDAEAFPTNDDRLSPSSSFSFEEEDSFEGMDSDPTDLPKDNDDDFDDGALLAQAAANPPAEDFKPNEGSDDNANDTDLTMASPSDYSGRNSKPFSRKGVELDDEASDAKDDSPTIGDEMEVERVIEAAVRDSEEWDDTAGTGGASSAGGKEEVHRQGRSPDAQCFQDGHGAGSEREKSPEGAVVGKVARRADESSSSPNIATSLQGNRVFVAPSVLKKSGFTTAAELTRAGAEAIVRAAKEQVTSASPQDGSDSSPNSAEEDLPLDLACTAFREDHSAETLFDQYLVVAVNFNAFERHQSTGFPITTPREVVQKFFAIVFNSLSMAGAHAEGLPYDDKDVGGLPTLACAMDLPAEADAIMAYAKDLRLTGRLSGLSFMSIFGRRFESRS